MKQEVIQDFLNLPGIAGVALMDRRSRPYFCGVDQTLNFQQKEALAQGILQVVETIPDGFESFEFKFAEHQVYIYKLEHGIILLVLTCNDLIYTDYLQTIRRLKATLQEDIGNAIAKFRLVAGNITLSGLNYRKASSASNSTSSLNSGTTTQSGKFTNHRVEEQPVPTPLSSNAAPPAGNSLKSPPTSASEIASNSVSVSAETGASSTPFMQEAASLKDFMLALNHLSKFTTQYLGTAVIVNYWKSTRPDVDWLRHFEIDRSAQLTYAGTQKPQQPLTAQEQQWLQTWVTAFIKRCSQVIRDFSALVEHNALDDQQKALLFGG